MAGKKKEFNNDGSFQTRFRALFYAQGKSQDQLAKILGVSRPTVSGWLTGKSLPDIQDFEKIARHYGVSADYLLGLSDTASPDVSVRAAALYTGLTEEAVEWLHIGLDDFECDGIGMSEQEKKQNLSTASALIQSRAFTKMIHNLHEIAVESYLERILTILLDQCSTCDSPEEDSAFYYASKADRDVVETHFAHVLKTKRPEWDESHHTPFNEMDDDELATEVYQALFNSQNANELRQFHAAKAFTGYIDQLVKEGSKRAEQRFVKK